MSAPAGWMLVSDEAHEIAEFTVYRSEDGARWRAVHRYDRGITFEFGDWARLDIRCSASRIGRGLRAAHARTGQ